MAISFGSRCTLVNLLMLQSMIFTNNTNSRHVNSGPLFLMAQSTPIHNENIVVILNVAKPSTVRASLVVAQRIKNIRVRTSAPIMLTAVHVSKFP